MGTFSNIVALCGERKNSHTGSVVKNRRFMKLIVFLFLFSGVSYGDVNLINGRPVGSNFKSVGTFDIGCTITKIGPKHFLTAAHCVGKSMKSISLNFQDFKGRVPVSSFHVHPSWIKDCWSSHCTGEEVGSTRMTPGRSDVALIGVTDETPIPVSPVHFQELNLGDDVVMVGAGCTRSVEPGGPGKMRYAWTKIISPNELIHEHSLYREISEVTGQSDWITAGFGKSRDNASLCPGDSGGPLLIKSGNEYKIVGIAADYTFDGPYQDGAPTITNLHTRLDDQSLNSIGQWIRENSGLAGKSDLRRIFLQ